MPNMSAATTDNARAGVEMIRYWEGFRSKAYKCPAGVWTIGYGSTHWQDGRPVKEGDHISQVEACLLLEDYLEKHVRPKLKGVQLTNQQIGALESLIYNIGWTTFSKSKCWAGIKARDWGTVFMNWDWIKAGGKVLPGLIKRRAQEKNMFFADI